LACSQQDIGYVTKGDNTDHFNYAQYSFTTCHQFNSLQVNPTTKDHKQHRAALAAMQSYATLVLEDPFGVAEELSYQRQLKIEPIMQMIVSAEQRYVKSMDDAYKQDLLSTSDVNHSLMKLIEQYKKKHPEEAPIIYDAQQKITESKEKKGWGQKATRGGGRQSFFSGKILHELQKLNAKRHRQRLF
jgi:hypothetical protein